MGLSGFWGIGFQIPLRGLSVLQVPLGLVVTALASPWYLYFGTILIDYLESRFNYIQYNPDVPLMLMCAQSFSFHSISLIFLCNLLISNFSYYTY